jgi:signal peptidase I
VIGLPGDKIEIRNGIVHINDTITDKYWRYKYSYYVSCARYYLMKSARVHESELASIDQEVFWVLLDPEDAVKLARDPKVKDIRLSIRPAGEKDEIVLNMNGTNWNLDNFGPYTVPDGHYFLMGDSRHNSADSRFHGPVPAEDMQGVIFE